jgi:hypothetical protein
MVTKAKKYGILPPLRSSSQGEGPLQLRHVDTLVNEPVGVHLSVGFIDIPPPTLERRMFDIPLPSCVLHMQSITKLMTQSILVASMVSKIIQ